VAHSRSCRSSGAGKRIFGILAVGAVAAVAVSLFTASSKPRVSPAPVPEKMAGMSPKRLQAHASDNAIVSGAAAAQNALAVRDNPDEAANPTVRVSINAPNTPLPPQPPPPAVRSDVSNSGKPGPAIKLSVRNENPEESREKAINEALLVAQRQIAEHLRNLDPPINDRPSIETIRAEYLRSDTVAIEQVTDKDLIAKWQAAGVGANRMHAHLDIEVSEDQVRKLRSVDRLGSAGWLAALAFAAVTALFGFLRVDGWTKGYLTTGLAVAFAGAVGAAVVLFFSAR